MSKTVAIEAGIKSLKPQLENEGYRVIDLRAGQTADAYILSGMDENMTGNMTRVSDGFVINAKGRQPEEILYDLKKHFNLKH